MSTDVSACCRLGPRSVVHVSSGGAQGEASRRPEWSNLWWYGRLFDAVVEGFLKSILIVVACELKRKKDLSLFFNFSRLHLSV